MSNDFLSTKRYFGGRDITLSDEWLESCIEWCQGENPASNCSLSTLHLKVYEQWLLLDLREVEKSTLPANLSQHKKYILNGSFSLQLLEIVDTSRPKLFQLQKIRNSSLYSHTTADKEWGPVDGKRVLLLLLTDGVTQVEAIEYSPIKSLNVNLPPGTKIKIVGPTTIRRGQMFLEEKNVEILGGEVEDLLICNAAENVLARALNLPENPKPTVIEDTFTNNERTDGVTTQRQNNGIEQFLVPTLSRQSNSARNVITITDEEERQMVSEIDLIEAEEEMKSRRLNNVVSSARSNSLSISAPRSNQLKSSALVENSITEEEERRIAAEIEMMMEVENDIREESKGNMSRVTSGAFMPPIMKENPVSRINYSDQPRTSTPKRSNPASAFEDENIFEDMDIDAHLDMIDAQMMKNSVVVSIASLKSRGACNGTFTIKAKFKSVTKKLTVTNNTWLLKLQIEDESGELEVYVDTDLITGIMGHSPSSIMALKSDILKKDQSATAVVMKTIDDLKLTIMKLDCVMEITFRSNEDSPSITALK